MYVVDRVFLVPASTPHWRHTSPSYN